MHILADRASKGILKTNDLKTKLTKLQTQKNDLQKVQVNQDISIRINPQIGLSDSCKNEINYDLQGFTLFSQHINDNQIDFSGDVIFARDLRDHNNKLIALHPNHEVYYLRDGELAKK